MRINLIKENKRIFGLDLMRATAILMVLFSHMSIVFPANKGIVGQISPLFGFLGAEIFFVLSGFLIGKILYQMLVLEAVFSRKYLFQFIKRRWLRTFPNYFLILILVLFLASAFNYTVKNSWKYFFFIQNLNDPMLPFFPESWGLSVEEFAYILLPIFLGLAFKWLSFKNKPLLFLGIVVGLILFFIGTKFGYYLHTTNTNLMQWNVALKSVVLYRLDSIFIGVLFSWLYFNTEDFWRKQKTLCLGLGLFLLLLMFVGIGFFAIRIETHPFFWNVLYLPITSLAIALFLPFLSEWYTSNQIMKTPITFISKISYSIYLLHYSVLFQLMRYFFNPAHYNNVQLLCYTACYLAITFLLSWILYRFYEKPIMDLRDKN